MSRSTPSFAPKALLVLALAGGCIARADIVVPELPPAVIQLSPGLQVRGGGELKFLGLSIYDGYYYCPAGVASGWSANVPFALQLVYHRRLRGVKIAERSDEEIARLGLGTSAQRERWSEQMKQVFVDVGPGDNITGVNIPHRGVRYFRNGAPIGEIADSAFAEAFFSIWLDPRTSEPALRKKLLAEP